MMRRTLVRLAGPVLHANEGLLVVHEVLAFNGKRDALRVRVEGMTEGKPSQASATLPIVSELTERTWTFPLRGVSYVGWGPSLHTGHRWISPQAYALDIARVGASGLTYRGDGRRFSDYYAHGAEVYAAAAGKVVELVNDAPEDESLLQSGALQCSGMPVTFSNIRVMWAETERALQSGDIVTAK
jgi:hypothetical protein